jgi:hypothetical protein
VSERISALARRVAGDPFFLASTLEIYRVSENLSDRELATHLGCREENLPLVALCRQPRRMPPHFRQDVDRIAARFSLNGGVLAQVVRHADTLAGMRRQTTRDPGLLLAARVREDEPPPDQTDGGESE